MEKRDDFYSRVSVFLSLGFWIPLLNMPLCILAVIFGIKSLQLAHREPDRYGGRQLAIAGIVLGAFPIILTIIGMIAAIYVPSFRETVLNYTGIPG
jgi:hypothetical protein